MGRNERLKAEEGDGQRIYLSVAWRNREFIFRAPRTTNW